MQLPLDSDDEMNRRLPNFSIGQDLTTYIQVLRQVVFGKTEHKHVTVVLGNPSCDLDSFISAFVLSYFYNGKAATGRNHQHPIYVPILNLPYVHKDDLWRLRPEFGVALRGAFEGLTPESKVEDQEEHQHKKAEYGKGKDVLEQLITIHELNNNPDTLESLHHAFKNNLEYEDRDMIERHKVETILVDHNAPSIETITESALKKRLKMVGVIDHHVEEDYVPKSATPRIIKLGIGSCMSLVVRHLQRQQIWTGLPHEEDSAKSPGYQQCARLALAPILVDTANLTAPDNKMSDIDRDAAAFLKSLVGDDFDLDDLYAQALAAKNNALHLMNTREIFGKDYKQYAEEVGGKTYSIGIGSSVKPLDWLTEHANGRREFVEEIPRYAKTGPVSLEIFGLLTVKEARKEICMFAFGQHGKKTIEDFGERATELDLQEWNEDKELSNVFDEVIGKGYWRVWFMGDTSKSRKQVAPLLRKALKSTGS